MAATATATSPRENSYGFAKRLAFVADVLRTNDCHDVLDMGCGTGNDLTIPLALMFPSVSFTGVDTDQTSIDFAQKHNQATNLKFSLAASGEYDIVIASEVLEHVADPVAFLTDLRRLLRGPSSRLVLTVPAGHGPFELASTAAGVWSAAAHRHGCPKRRAWRVLRRSLTGSTQVAPGSPMSSAGTPRGGGDGTGRNTLASSPHINFFTRRELSLVFAAAGCTVEEFRPRTVLCGAGLDRCIRSGKVAEWNARLADRVPALSSDWMFVLAPRPAGPSGDHRYTPDRFAKFRRWLNTR